MQSMALSREYNKYRYDSLSIPGYVTRKNKSRGPRNGPPIRQTMYLKARDMLRKVKLPKNDSCQTFLERWYRDNTFRKSLCEEGWTEEQIQKYNVLVLKTILVERLLKKGDDGKRTDILFLKKEGKIRSR